MQEVTITMTLRINDDACVEDWVPQSILDQLEEGEELLAYDDTERVWEVAELPPGVTQEQAQANYEEALAHLATIH